MSIVGIIAVVLAIGLFVWGMISLGRNNSGNKSSKKKSKKTKKRNSKDWEDYMMEEWDMYD